MKKLYVVSIALILCFAFLTPAALAQGRFDWPTSGEVILGFAPESHRGIDISAKAGTMILAAQDGVICWVGKTPRGEPCISIEHTSGLSTTYLPVDSLVSKGQSVSAGDVIGVLSSIIDESSQVEHLHFGLYETATRDNKAYLDPLSFLPALDIESQESDEASVGGETAAEAGIQFPQALAEQAASMQNYKEEPPEPQVLQLPVGEQLPVNQTSPGNQSSGLARQTPAMAQPPAKSVATSSGIRIGDTSSVPALSSMGAGNFIISTGSAAVKATEAVSAKAGFTNPSAPSAATAGVAEESGAKQAAPAQSLPRRNLSSASLTQNPFGSPAAKKSAGEIAGRQENQSGPKWANQIINWQLLPEVIVAIAIVAMFALSLVQVARGAKQIGQNLPQALDATCC